jgi:type 1 glutamine amidotransferase
MMKLTRYLTTAVLAVVMGVLWGARAAAAERPKQGEVVPPDQIEKVTAALPEKPYVEPARPHKMLVFTLTKGFRHSSIPLAAKTMELMGKKTGVFTTVVSDDLEMLRPEKLAEFDLFCSDQNTGDLTSDEQLKQSLLDFVKNGKGWVGIHAATDVGGWKFPAYHEMIGGVFAGHPFRRISVKIDDPASPLCVMFEGKGFEISDEIYTFKDPYSREKLHVLSSIDWENANITQKGTRADNDYALSWIREYGKGRVFYCAFGHDDQIWWNPAILRHYLAGIQYAAGDLKADATPSAKVKVKPAPGPDLRQQPKK